MCAGLYFYQLLPDKQHCQKVKAMLGIELGLVPSFLHNQINSGSVELLGFIFDIGGFIFDIEGFIFDVEGFIFDVGG